MDRLHHPPERSEPPEPGSDPEQKRQLHPLPPGLVEFYGLLAVLVVLMPEWLAGGALRGLGLGGGDNADLPAQSTAWQRIPELRLATMNLAELRLLARQQGMRGYGRLARQRLSQRLLRRLKQTPGNPKSL
jgi:hypothetical protein